MSQNKKNPALKIFIFLTGMTFLVLGLTFRKLPPVVPLYYCAPWGEEQLGRSFELFLIPFATIVFFVINFLLAKLFVKKDLFLVQILMWTATFLSLLGLITITKTILLVI